VVSCEFGFWIISDSLESSYNDVPVRWSHVTSGHPRRLWIASGVLISPDAMSTSAVMCDDGRACKQDTSATTWPTYILHASRRMIITAATISTMIDYSQKTKTPLKMSRNYSLARLPYLLVWCSNMVFSNDKSLSLFNACCEVLHAVPSLTLTLPPQTVDSRLLNLVAFVSVRLKIS